jgi:putative FmdB family regulatory protein
MPIFEFVCNECEQPFEDLIFGNDTKGVICPACGSEQVQKKMSTFSSKIAGSSSSLSFGASSAASCNTGNT